MKMFKMRCLRAILRKWRKISAEALAYDHGHGHGHHWDLLLGSCTEDDECSIPKDVPKGHLVVYVGDELKRFVVRVSSLHHPLFRALLDRAQEVYEFSPGSKLCIPCDEAVFAGVLRYVGSQQERRVWDVCL